VRGSLWEAQLPGFRLKEAIRAHLLAGGHEVRDYGTNSDEPVDYPDVAEAVARDVAAGAVDRAVLCCGIWLGMAIVANTLPGVRVGPVADPYSAERAMKSNNARVLCLGGRVVAADGATILVEHWIGA
jgi:ribose 5-phosphate isomerase B